jgi:hypothetical protein
MPERTRRSQADEALRQATTPSAEALPILHAIADRIAGKWSDKPMTKGLRMGLALTYATDAHGFRSEAADALEAELLRHMPKVDRELTRGEYAIVMRPAGKVDA